MQKKVKSLYFELDIYNIGSYARISSTVVLAFHLITTYESEPLSRSRDELIVIHEACPLSSPEAWA
jgi:hypothetical protein